MLTYCVELPRSRFAVVCEAMQLGMELVVELLLSNAVIMLAPQSTVLVAAQPLGSIVEQFFRALKWHFAIEAPQPTLRIVSRIRSDIIHVVHVHGIAGIIRLPL